MALHKHARVEWYVEETAELSDAGGFMLAAAVSEEDEGDLMGL